MASDIYEQFHGLAVSFYSIPLFPILYIVHSTIAALNVRRELGGVEFAINHPIASCVGHFIVTSSGGMAANLLLGNTLLVSVTLPHVVIAFSVWYLVFFSPLDIYYNLVTILPMKLLLGMLSEIRRSLNIMNGVMAGCGLFGLSVSHFLAISIIGMVKGSGSQWGITMYQWIAQSPATTGRHELIKLSLVTKASFTCAVMYSLNELKVLHFAREDLCLWAAILLVSLKVYAVLIAEVDPFNLPAHTLWSVITYASPSRELQNASPNPANQKLKAS